MPTPLPSRPLRPQHILTATLESRASCRRAWRIYSSSNGLPLPDRVDADAQQRSQRSGGRVQGQKSRGEAAGQQRSLAEAERGEIGEAVQNGRPRRPEAELGPLCRRRAPQEQPDDRRISVERLLGRALAEG